MSNWWSKLDTWQKRAKALSVFLTSLVAIVGLLWSGVSLLATDKEVTAVKEELDDRFLEKSLYDARITLKQIQFQLLDETISPAQRALAEETKEEVIRVIECIQANREHCEQ